MNPFAGLNGFAPNPAAARVVPNNAGLPNGLNVQGSLPMDDNQPAWMQNQGLGLALGQRMQQLPGVGLQGLPQVGGGAQRAQSAGLAGLAASTGLGGAGLAGQNLQAMQLQQQLQAQQQQQAAQQAQQALLQQQLRQQQLQQQLQAQAVQQQQQHIAALRQQQQLQQQLQQHQLLQQQQQLATAGLQGNPGLVQNSLQSLVGGTTNQQLLLNHGAQAGGNRQADLLVGNQLQLQGAAGQVLTSQQQQQLLQQQLLNQAAQQGAAASQGLQFGGTGATQATLLMQNLQQASNAQKLRNLAQLNAAQQDLARRQQAQLQAQAAQVQQQQVQAQALQLQRLRQQQQLQQLQAAQAAVQQQQSANQQAVNAAALAALRGNGGPAAAAAPTPEQQQQLMRLVAAAAGKADTVGSLPPQLATASATAALAQRQLAAGLAVQPTAAGVQGTAASGPSAGTGAVAATQAMLQAVLAGNRPSFEPANPARVGVIGQERTKQASTDLGASTPAPVSTNAALSSLAGAVALGNLGSLAQDTAGPSRQATPPPASSTPTSGAPSAVAGASPSNSAATVADMAGHGLPITASPEHVEAFLKAVGKRFAAMGLTIEQALEFEILKGLTKEQLAVLSESQHTANLPSSPASTAAESSAAAAAAAAVQGLDGLGHLLDQALPITIATAGAPVKEPPAPETTIDANTQGGNAAEVDATTATAHDDDDKILDSLLEPEDKPPTSAVAGALDDATAALLAMSQMDANFNAFTYGFFGDTSDTRGGLGDLLGELEPEGAALDGVDGLDPALPAVCDLSELTDLEPVDPAQLVSWGSMDVGQSSINDEAALAAAAGAARADVSLITAPEEGALEVADVGLQPTAAAVIQAEALASNLKGLSLGAGFE